MIFPCIICFMFSSGYLRSWHIDCPSYGAQMNKGLLIALAKGWPTEKILLTQGWGDFPWLLWLCGSPLPPLGSLRKLQASLGRAGCRWTFPLPAPVIFQLGQSARRHMSTVVRWLAQPTLQKKVFQAQGNYTCRFANNDITQSPYCGWFIANHKMLLYRN